MPQSISEIKSWKMELILTQISKYDSYVTVFYTYERTAVLIIWGWYNSRLADASPFPLKKQGQLIVDWSGISVQN